MTIRRLAAADCTKLNAFLTTNFTNDAASGGALPAPTAAFLQAQLAVAPTWIDIVSGKIRGVLGPAMMNGVREVQHDPQVIRTFVYFNRLIVDYAIYTASRATALQIAHGLTLFAANEIQAGGSPPDDIIVEGLLTSRGASWCRLLTFTEEPRGPEGRWVCPFADIWARLNAVVIA